jgi:hypothetical protein
MMLAQSQPPQILNPPCCEFINEIPWWAFLAIHIVIFLFAAVYAGRGFGVGQRGFGWGFTLIAVGEISYMTYHLNITTFLFAHTISEVLLLVGLIMLFVAAVRSGVLARRPEAMGTAEPARPVS